MVAKLSSVRIISAASLVTSVPVIPIATPMSALVSAGASFTPSPVMATMLPCSLRMLTRRTLSSGATRATTPMPSISALSWSSGMAANSAPVSARPSMPSWPAMAAAVVAWSPVIMRTRMPASLQRAMASLASLRGGSTIPTSASSSRSLDQRQQVARRVERRGVEVAPGDGEHPHAVAGQPVVLGEDPIHRAAHRRRRALGVQIVRRARQQDVGRSLDEAAHDRPAPVLHLVERRHQLVLGVERHLGDSGIGLARVLDVDPALGRQHDERALGRVADARPVADDGIVGQRHRQHERLERDVAGAGHAQDATGRRVALAVDGEAPADDHELARRHLVQRERARLVGADRRRRAERLDRLQPLDDRALVRQLLGADRQQHRDHGRETGRDGGDGEGDARQEQRVEVLAAGEAEDDDQRQRAAAMIVMITVS